MFFFLSYNATTIFNQVIINRTCYETTTKKAINNKSKLVRSVTANQTYRADSEGNHKLWAKENKRLMGKFMVFKKTNGNIASTFKLILK